MRVRGRFFELTDRFTPDKRRRQAVRDEAPAARVVDRNGPSKVPRLIISVPKRVLRSAVRRNTVKRVVRESWRQAPAIELACFSPPAVLVRLVRDPWGSGVAAPGVAAATPVAESPFDQSGSLATADGEAGAKGGAGSRSAASGRTGLRRFKQVLRADLDAIWAGGDAHPLVRRRTPPGRDR